MSTSPPPFHLSPGDQLVMSSAVVGGGCQHAQVIVGGGFMGHAGWLNSWRAASTSHLLYLRVTLRQAVGAGFRFRCIQQYAMSPSEGGSSSQSSVAATVKAPILLLAATGSSSPTWAAAGEARPRIYADVVGYKSDFPF